MAANVQINITGENKAGKAFKEAADGAKGLEKGFDGLRDGADDTERRIVGFRDSLTGTQDIMKGLKDGDMIALTTGFADMASSVANLGADLLDWGKKALEGAKNVVEAHGAAVIAKAKDIASAVAHKAASVASTIATQAQAAAQWALNAAMEANPILLIVVALVALAAGIIYAYQHSETFRNIVDQVGEALKWVWDNVLKPVADWIQGHFVDALEIAGRVMLAVLTGGMSEVAKFIYDHWDEIINFIKGLPGKIGAAAYGMWDGLTDAFKEAINVIIRGWNSFTSHIGIPEIDTHIPGIGKVGGWSLGDRAHIPELAEGGLVKANTGGTIVRLAEAGVDEWVIPANRMQKLGNAGPSITVVVEGNVYGVDQMDRLIADAIRRNARRGVA